jgi:hypothetical protein
MTITPRHTFLLTSPDAPRRSWTNPSDPVNPRTIRIPNLAVLEYTLRGLDPSTHDVERIIVDHAATPTEHLRLLSALPDHFAGDVMLIGAEGAFLSASSRGDGRKLWQVSEENLRFYLVEHRLITDGPRAMTAPPVVTGIRVARRAQA